ncbi:sulfite exporter TauE/SafE family protein [Zhihengliuella halotolerans]|uniref:sulfite exporter TauE/SafE family protein n=1 Tax=Zhihengliuella halotolerans TaxID=370736 RepID=UPI000C807F97|nr:sulfite exporter TauE/SafE family protein [Zhihengliuella halotolerans]
MRSLIVLAVIGFFAQLVDGSLGMAYGVTSTTLLLFAGIAPASASAIVHLSEVGTTLVSGVAHWKFGNVDWRVVGIMAVPGGVAAFFGAHFLVGLDGEAAKPVVSTILLVLGIYVLYRFLRMPTTQPAFRGTLRKRLLVPLAVAAGALDAVGGGGWGPVGTPTLLASGKIEPRKVVGSIDTSEFVVALGASLGFLSGLGAVGIDFAWVLALLAGGVVAAPLAAWLVRLMAPRVLAVAAGGLIVFTNSRTLLGTDAAVGLLGGNTGSVVLTVLFAAWAALVFWVVRRELRARAAEREHRAALASTEA